MTREGLGIIVAIVIVATCIYFVLSRLRLKKILQEIRSLHKIDSSYISSSGCLAFSDGEKIIYFYSTATKSQESISYDDLVSAGEFDKNNTLILFSVLNSTSTQYRFVGKNEKSEIISKMESILQANFDKAKKEYESKITIPPNVAAVKIHRYEGLNADIPGGLLKKTLIYGLKTTIYT